MKILKILIGIVLSFSTAFIGIGYAQLTDEITAIGVLNHTHTTLYFSDVTPNAGVAVKGYSETLINLTAEEGGIINLSITNPTNYKYYYLDYTSSIEGFKLSESMVVGVEIASDDTLIFTVSFFTAGEYIIKFNFTKVAPKTEYEGMTIEGLDTNGDGMDDVYAVTGYDQSNENVDIPSSVNGVPVVEIVGSAFAEYSDLKTVWIPKSITSIGADVFADKEGVILKYEQITLLYEGTYEQWQAIVKDENWDRYIGKGSRIYFLADLTYSEETASNGIFNATERIWSEPKAGTYS
ncbi:MAG: hypothetical protein IKB67_03985 [Clostridia bacterium]|nr:hypothetical protein [Clostridia bacterium]